MQRKAAQSTSTTDEFLPEADVFFTVNQSVRIIVSAKKERDVEFSNAEAGTSLELSLGRFLLGRFIEQDTARVKRVSIRLGYRCKRSLNTQTGVNENRPIAEFTNRWALAADVLMSNRARGELRLVNGEFSWRYRDQLKLEKDFRLRHYALTVHAAGEAFYDAGPRNRPRVPAA